MTQLSLLVKSCQGHRYNQTDPPPPLLLRDRENLLNITLNNPEVEGRVLARLRFSRAVAYGLVVLWASSGPGRAMCNCLGEHCHV